MPWSVPLIEALEARGIMLSVASAADRIKVEANLACLGRGTRDFASVVTGADVERAKPAPDIFLRAAELCKVDPSDALVCEDAISGVRAAKSAGMTAAAVTTSFGREALTDAGADFVFDDLLDLLKVV
jgi:sugar-phosphatase